MISFSYVTYDLFANPQQQELGNASDLLESALNYSLTFSRRPPQAFVPHQKLLWMLDAWTSVDAGCCNLLLIFLPAC